MAGSKFQYDESGGTFFYFLLAFLALVLIPTSYYLWPKKDSKGGADARSSKKCNCDHCQEKRSRLVLKEPWKKTKQRLIKILIILGWVAFLATAYKVAHLERDYVDWDPFEILQIDRGASQAEIKRAYRKLSLIYHPDKDTGDAKKFLQLTKAHAALTDEEAKKNWEMYGNPDGPGAMSFGIALPSWIVEKENSIWVLGLYALVFMVALPVVVGVWWHRSIKFGGDQILLGTTKLYYYFINKTTNMNLRRLLMVLAGSLEFQKGQNNEIIERPSDNIEVPVVMKEFTNLGEKNKEPPLCYIYSMKARTLLFAHLSRLQLPPTTLDLDRMYIVKKCPYLIQEFVQCIAQLIMLAYNGHTPKIPNVDMLENCMKLSPMIIQALWENKSPLLQLPHIAEDMLKHFVTRTRNIRSIRAMVNLKSSERRSLLRTLTEQEYEDVIRVCNQMPHVQMSVKVEVLDDEKPTTITVGSIVTVTIFLKRQNMGDLFELEDVVEEKDESKEESVTANQEAEVNVKKNPVWQKQKKKKGKGGKTKKKGTAKQQHNFVRKRFQNDAKVSVEEKEQPKNKTHTSKESTASTDESGEENDRDSDGEKAVNGSDAEEDDEQEEQEEVEWNKIQAKLGNKDKIMETKSRVSHEVHCPFFPDEKQEYWWLYIMDRKRRSLMTMPHHLTDLVHETEVALKFTAPFKVGTYQYHVHLRSDSYLDADVTETFKLNVEEGAAPEIPEYGLTDEEKDDNDDGTSDLPTDEDDFSISDDDDDDD